MDPLIDQTTSNTFMKKNRLLISVFGLTISIVAIAGLLTSLWISKLQTDTRSEAATDVQTNFSFGTPTQSLVINQQASNTVSVNTGSRKLTAAAIALKYDPQYIQVISIEKTEKLPIILETAKINNTAGTASITLGTTATEAPVGSFAIATIKYKVLKASSGVKMSFDPALLLATITDQNTNAAQIAGDLTIAISGGTNPTAEVTMPTPSTCAAQTGKYKAGVPIEFTTKVTAGNPAATESRVFIAKVDSTGLALVSQGAENASCLGGAGVVSGTRGLWCRIDAKTIPASGLTSKTSWASPVVGKYVVTINAMVPNGISCSGNPTCDYSTDSTFTKSSCTGYVNCSNNDWHMFEVVAASSCPVATPNPTPTATPAPTPTPAAGNSKLQLSFKLQGLKKAGIKQTATIQVKYVPTGQTAAITKTYTKEFESDATGLLKSSTPLNLSDISIQSGTPITNAKIFVKVPTSLTKLVGTTTLTSGGTATVASAVVLPVGDFKREPASEANVLKFNDLALAITEFKQLENPVTTANKIYDVNFDGTFNLQDFAIVLVNFDQLEYSGETP